MGTVEPSKDWTPERSDHEWSATIRGSARHGRASAYVPIWACRTQLFASREAAHSCAYWARRVPPCSASANWLFLNHREDSQGVEFGDWNSVAEAEQGGILRAQYAAEWVAFLEANS